MMLLTVAAFGGWAQALRFRAISQVCKIHEIALASIYPASTQAIAASY